MIWDLIVRMFMGLVRGIIGLLPTSGPPGWVSEAGQYIETGVDKVGGLSAWVPLETAMMVLAAVMACIAAGFFIKIMRIVASFFTAGGGSAA